MFQILGQNVRRGVNFVTNNSSEERAVRLKVIVTIKPIIAGFFAKLINPARWFDFVSDLLLGNSLLLELVSAQLNNPLTGLATPSVSGYAYRTLNKDGLWKYEADIELPAHFGEVGAVLIENERRSEVYVAEILLEGFSRGPQRITCHSWVDPKSKSGEKRVFFTNKSYLPSQTPDGLRVLRERELSNLKGDGHGERKSSDRIYDYDTYNDLGDPDNEKDDQLGRPVMGGAEHPYPRRCRTGRDKCKDEVTETKSDSVYVPRNEQFSAVKQAAFSAKKLYSVLHAVIPSIQAKFDGPDDIEFPHFTAIHLLFNEGIHIPGLQHHHFIIFLITILARIVRAIRSILAHFLQFELPAAFHRDSFSWTADEEFCRQTLAGLNPYSIKLVTPEDWPLRSKLDPAIYGPQESKITEDLINWAIKGYMPVKKALKKNKLFMLDYHDAFLPFVLKVRKQKGRTLYGSRTLFILSKENTLRLLAIELTRPPYILNKDGKDHQIPQWKEVFTPKWDATSKWLWRFAKAHVLAHDAGYHQLVSHWLRTHCCTEPYIIATKRQLSWMHPINRFLNPFFRYTMEINALARKELINADGIIESTFSPGRYSVEMSSAYYKSDWRFDHEGLPADLIKRGMAVEDETAPHGLKLRIEDYPFANDGLDLWDILKEWATNYVNVYYKDPSLVKKDEELQAWWTEIRTVGHGDKKDEPWWPKLETPEDLIQILTTMIWVTSGHHAAVNFGQYGYGGFFPNRPTLTRTKMPTEDPIDDEDWDDFTKNPVATLLKCFPSQLQATKVMIILDVLSSHSPEEEYIGVKENMEPAYKEDKAVEAAFVKFCEKLQGFSDDIDVRNKEDALLNSKHRHGFGHKEFKNRHGAGVVPYELLKPLSKEGVTNMGVPYSISI